MPVFMQGRNSSLSFLKGPLQYLVAMIRGAMHVQFYFWLTEKFQRTFCPPNALGNFLVCFTFGLHVSGAFIS